MTTRKNNPIRKKKSLNQRLIEKELLILGKDSIKVSEQDPQKLFEQGAGYLHQARDASSEQEKAKCYPLACFYLYLSQCMGHPNARSIRLLAQGEWASRYYDSKLKGIFCRNDKLGLKEAKEFIPTVLQSYFDFSKNAFIHETGIGVYLIPDYILCAFQIMLDSGFAFDRELGSESSNQEMNPVDFLAQSLHRSQGIECEELMGEDLASFLLWCFDRTPEKADFGREIFGMPSECAYLIGMSYLEGKIIPHDKVQACRFLAYAMLTGSPRACLAWAVHFESFGYEQQDNGPQDLLSDYCGTLFHGLMLCVLHSNVDLFRYANSFRLEGLQDKDGINIEYSLMYSLCVILAFRSIRHKGCPVELAFDAVLCLFFRMLNLFEKDPEAEEYLRCALAGLIFACRDDELHLLRLNLATARLNKKELNHTTEILDSLSMIMSLIEPLLAKKSDLALKFICYIPTDPANKAINKALHEMAARNNANALFKLGTQQFYADDDIDIDTFSKLAKLGHPVAQYNLSLDYQTGRIPYKTALDLAMKSLRSGIPMSFYTLYALLKDSKNSIERQLAYTCLRYASEFILPKLSVTEFEKVKKARQYKPLPYMQVIEEIEKKASTDSTCAVFIGTLYTHGTIMPNDQYKALTYFRKAVELGDLVSIAELSSVYAVNWSVPDKDFVVSGMQHALDIMSRYGIGAQKKASNKGRIAHTLAKKLYEALKNGHTWLEMNIFDRCKDDAVWRVFDIDNDALASADEKNPALFYDRSSEELLNIYAEMQDSIYLCDDYTKSNDKHLLELLTKVAGVHDESYEKRMAELRVLLSLRGYAGTSKDTIDEDILHGANCDSYLCNALYLTDLRPLSIDYLAGNSKSGKSASRKDKLKKANSLEKETVQKDDDGFLDFTSLS